MTTFTVIALIILVAVLIVGVGLKVYTHRKLSGMDGMGEVFNDPGDGINTVGKF